MIRLSGKTEQEIGIRFTGLRDGEKLFEELSYPNEEVYSTSCAKIRQIRGAPQRWRELGRKLNTNLEFPSPAEAPPAFVKR